MKIYRFGIETGKNITQFESNFMMSRILKTERTAQIGCMHLETHGLVGFHQAVVPQLLLVINGEGWVRCDDGINVNVKIGDAVYWAKGEGHETGTDTGLNAIVVESEELNPSDYMPVKENEETH